MPATSPPGVLQIVLSLAAGGTERLVVDTVKALHGRFRMAVCCLDESGALAPELTALGIPVSVVGRRPGFHPLLGRTVAHIARQHGATVFHCHQYTPFVYGACARIWRPGARIVFTEHGRLFDQQPSAKRRWANRLLRRVPSRIYTVSADLRAHLLAEDFRPEQVCVLHNGVKPAWPGGATARADARRALGLPMDAFLVGAVGRLDPVKRLDTLLRAISVVRQRHPDALLVLVGDGPERDSLAEQVVALKLEKVVTFAGYRTDVREIMPALDVYVNSSTTEGISLTILEAMYAAVPVVATAVGGTPEIVVDGESGLLVPAQDSRALAEAILLLRERPDRGLTIAQAGRRRVEADFSFERMVEEYASAYCAAAPAAVRRD